MSEKKTIRTHHSHTEKQHHDFHQKKTVEIIEQAIPYSFIVMIYIERELV